MIRSRGSRGTLSFYTDTLIPATWDASMRAQSDSSPVWHRSNSLLRALSPSPVAGLAVFHEDTFMAKRKKKKGGKGC